MTEAEKIFVQRMLPHFMTGKSVEDCAKAVLEDDERLFVAFHERRHNQYFPTPDERGCAHSTPVGKGDVIISELARTVYKTIRSTSSV